MAALVKPAASAPTLTMTANIVVHEGDLSRAAQEVGLSVDSLVAYLLAAAIADLVPSEDGAVVQCNGAYMGASANVGPRWTRR